jgi:FkbM family methyltransferase
MENVLIDNHLLFYYPSNDPVVLQLSRNKILFGKANFDMLNFFIKEDGAIVDCGAHIGTFCFTPAHNGTEVIAIDGAVRNAQCLNKTFENMTNVIVENCILLDKVKNCTFSTTYGPFGYAKSDHTGLDISDTLDNIVSRHNKKISGIKYDIEGNEIDAINGSLETIGKYKPPLLIEVNGHCLRMNDRKPYDLFDLLDKISYSYFLPIQNKFLSINKNHKFPFCVTDIICIHNDNRHEYNIEILPSLQEEQINNLIQENYSKSNQDCRKYFEYIL